jgi:exopolysaccharide biosynthesis polyprenyl glycosylphosphotransferase
MKAIYYGALNIVLISLLIEPANVLDTDLIIFISVLLVIPALYLFRVEILRYILIRFSGTSFKRNVIIVGDGRAGKMLATKLMYENPIGLNILGFVDDDKQLNEEVVIGKKVIGNLNNLKDIIDKFDVDELLIAVDDEDNEKVLEVIDLCKSLKISVRVTSELFNIVSRKLSTEKYADIPVIDVSSHYNNAITLGMKRTFDLVASTIALIVLSPVMLVITTLIKVTSSGSILFKQTRVGKHGKTFQFYKFRSMTNIDGEDEDRKKLMLDFMNNENGDADTKIINNSRVTWIGNLIRKSSLDELPQLFNVLRGEMSLVGPRPCLPYEYENYDDWQKRRVSVIPGCTGVWQVWGRSSVSFKESVVLDLYYINNMSPWFDLQLIYQTIPAMLTARGAK